MKERHRESLSDYRLKSAQEHLKSSKLLFDSGLFKDSIGRSYYAMFSAARAILAIDGVDFSKHAGVISYFQREYIKSRKFDVKYSKYLVEAFEIRNYADYADFYVVAKNDVIEQYEHAVDFCNEVKKYLDKRKTTEK